MVSKSWVPAMGKAPISDTPDEALKQRQAHRRKREIDRAEEIEDKQHDATVAKLDKEKEQANAAVEKVATGAVQSGIGISGSIDVGHVNLMENQAKLEAQNAALISEAQSSAARTAEENARLRDQVTQSRLDLVQNSLAIKLDSLTDIVADAKASKANEKSFEVQFKEAEQFAAMLGLQRPGPETTDLQTQLSLSKLNFDQKLEIRKMEREDRRAERAHQLELAKFDELRESNRQEAERQRKRDEVFASAPEAIGRTIAAALRDSAAEGGESPDVSSEGPSQRTGQTYRLRTEPGEAGVTDCPKCQQKGVVAVGATAKKAICGECGTPFVVERVAGRRQEENEEDEE